MKLNSDQQLTVINAAAGLLLAAVYFAKLADGLLLPYWLPALITGIGGVEISLFVNGQLRRRRNR